MSYFMIVIVLGLAILLHELGHLLAAKHVKIPIARFSVGFGPKLWGFIREETEYRISLIPVGGYVLPQIESEEDFLRISPLKRIQFALGGPLANIVTAILCLSVMNMASTGISLSSALIKPFLMLGGMAYQIVVSIPLLFSHPDSLSGAIGIVAAGGRYTGLDITRLFSFLVMMNINLAVLNLLPLQPLDGGKILQYLLESIHKPLARLHAPMAVAGWVAIMLLILYTAFLDISHLIT